MLSKNKANYIISLQKKRVRDEEGLFVVEGDKIVREFLQLGAPVVSLVAKQEYVGSLADELTKGVEEIIPVSYDELKRVSSLKSPHNALAIVKMNPIYPWEDALNEGLSAALDCVQDPGNLGTIIRAAAWFGVKNLFCSPNSVDLYNAKVIQASMGAVLHVRVLYVDLHPLFQKASSMGKKIYGTTLDGDDVYRYDVVNDGIILLGNESKGVSEELMSYVTDKIMIPKKGRSARPGIDSLNVGMAASVIFSEFARRTS